PARPGPGRSPAAIGVVAVDRDRPDHREQAHLLVVAEVVGVDLVRAVRVELLTVPATAQGVTSGLAQLGGVATQTRVVRQEEPGRLGPRPRTVQTRGPAHDPPDGLTEEQL